MFAFIDVSGNPYAPKNSPWVALNVVCIRNRSMYDITSRLFRLKRDILNNEYLEIKSTDVVNDSTLRNPDLNKFKFLDRFVYDCIDHHDCSHASVAFRSSAKNLKSSIDYLPKHYVDALWRIEAVARKWHENDATVVIDNNARTVDRSLAFAFNNYIYRSANGDMLSHILPVPIFADSATTPGIQIADIAAGIVRNYYCRGIDSKDDASMSPEEKILKKYYDVICGRSLRSYKIDRYLVSGIYVPKKEYVV